MDTQKLRAELLAARGVGEIVVWSASRGRGGGPAQAIADFLTAPPAPLTSAHASSVEDLAPVDAGTATRLLRNVIRYDLAYHEECTDEATALAFAERIVGTLSEPARWWTNGTLGLGRTGSWNPFTEATFDTGVIGVSDDSVLVVWFPDED